MRHPTRGNSYMNQEGLQSLYRGKSNIELLLIATNYDGGWRSDAVETATIELLSRYKHVVSLEQVRDEEMKRISELTAKCSLCQNPEVVYSEDFSFCRTPDLDGKEVRAGIELFSVLGALPEKPDCFQLQFRLCPECLAQRRHRGRVRTSLQDYYAHPMRDFLKSLGYTYIYSPRMGGRGTGYYPR